MDLELVSESDTDRVWRNPQTGEVTYEFFTRPEMVQAVPPKPSRLKPLLIGLGSGAFGVVALEVARHLVH